MPIDLLNYMIWHNTSGAGGKKTVGPLPVVTVKGKGKPAIRLLVDLPAVQDLNGYANPWPSGGGDQKFDIESHPIEQGSIGSSSGNNMSSQTRVRSNGYMPVSSSTQYVMSFEGAGQYYGHFYASDQSYVGNTSGWINSGSPFTTTADTAYLRVVIAKSDSSEEIVPSDVSNIMLNLGETAKEYKPYFNFCPFTGWTGTEIWDDPAYGGIIEWNQIVNVNVNSQTKGGVIYTKNEDGSWTLTGTPESNNGFLNMDFVSGQNPYQVGHVYYLPKGCTTPYSIGLMCAGTGTNVYSSTGDKIFSATSLSTSGYCRIQISNLKDTDIGTVRIYPQMFDLTQMFGPTVANYVYDLETETPGAGVAWFKNLFPKEYYAYDSGTPNTCVSAVNGDTYASFINDWTEAAGTIYCGTLDVVSGLLTVTHQLCEVGSDKYTLSGPISAYKSMYVYSNTEIGDMIIPNNKSDVTKALCNVLPSIARSAASGTNIGILQYHESSNQVRFAFPMESGYETVNAVYQTFSENPIQALIPLKEVVTYQLTPQQVTLLKGTNNIFSDTGDVTLVYV